MLSVGGSDGLILLKSRGKIHAHKSPSENAIMLLDSILTSDVHKMDDIARASIRYAQYVLTLDRSQAETPVSLLSEGGAKQIDEEMSPAVQDWLVSDYTQNSAVPRKASKRKLSFKMVAIGVKFAVKMRDSIRSTHLDKFVYDVQPEERERIADVLQDIGTW
jgi:hypothetical protein